MALLRLPQRVPRPAIVFPALTTRGALAYYDTAPRIVPFVPAKMQDFCKGLR